MGKWLRMCAILAGVFLQAYAAAATQFEAENATLSGGANRNTNHAGFTGTGFVDGFFQSSTAQASFATVSATAAGPNTVTLRYSAGNGTSTNTGLYVNGVKIKNITCNATANWDTWANEVETVTLNAGNNTIAYKAETSSASSINLDNISVQAIAQTFTVTYNGNGFTSGTLPASASFAQGATVTVAAASTLARTGFNFSGWNTAANGSGTSFSPGSTFIMGAANVTLFAIWTAIPTLTLTIGNDGHGATSPSGPVTVTAGATTSITATPSAGFQFSSWSVVSGSAAIASATLATTTVTTPGGNATLQANFTATAPAGGNGLSFAEISGPVTVTSANTVVLALPFTAPSAGFITVTATGLYGTASPYSDEQRGLESFITLNATSGGSLSGFLEKPVQQGGAQYVSETKGFPVTAGANTLRLIATPRSTLTTTVYQFARCRMTVVFSTQKL
jgi:uncharacterized repeat protein (TIGR02543 family)